MTNVRQKSQGSYNGAGGVPAPPSSVAARRRNDDHAKLPLPWALVFSGLTFAMLTGLAATLLGFADTVATEAKVLFEPRSEWNFWAPQAAQVLALVPLSALFHLAVYQVVWFFGKYFATTWEDAWLGSRVGGWTSVVASAWWLVLFFDFSLSVTPSVHVIGFLVLGPVVAIPLFQYVGAWQRWPRDAHLLIRDHHQFAIRHLLIATAGVAAGLGLAKVVGLLGSPVVLYLACASVYQLGTTPVVFAICRARHRRFRDQVVRAERGGRVSEGRNGDGGGMRG